VAAEEIKHREFALIENGSSLHDANDADAPAQRLHPQATKANRGSPLGWLCAAILADPATSKSLQRAVRVVGAEGFEPPTYAL
jgi:hypothetical protein